MTTHEAARAVEREEPDELYIGYLPAAPPGYARFVRRVVTCLLACAAALAATFAALAGSLRPRQLRPGPRARGERDRARAPR